MTKVMAGIAGAIAGFLILPVLGHAQSVGMEQWDYYLTFIFAFLGTIVGLLAAR